MYLSQLVINPRSREARFDLSDRYELHRTLLSAFPEMLPEGERVLYRVEDGQQTPVVPLLVQSHDEPHWENVTRFGRSNYLYRPVNVRQISPHANVGHQLPFRLQANPTVKRDGKRHALYADDDLLAWLTRKSASHGFSVVADSLRIVKLGKKHGKKREQTWHAVQFDGVLTVMKKDLFYDALTNGIGSAKAFGFGLLSIPYGAF